MLSYPYFKVPKMLRLALFAVVVILLSTLFPYDFYGMTRFHSFSGLWNELTVLRSDFLQDFAANILLFLPLGFALGGLFAKRKSSHVHIPVKLATDSGK